MTWPAFHTAYLESSPENLQSKRWFIIETYWTSDGPRTRVCDGRYETLLEAEEARLKRQERN